MSELIDRIDALELTPRQRDLMEEFADHGFAFLRGSVRDGDGTQHAAVLVARRNARWLSW